MNEDTRQLVTQLAERMLAKLNETMMQDEVVIVDDRGVRAAACPIWIFPELEVGIQLDNRPYYRKFEKRKKW